MTVVVEAEAAGERGLVGRDVPGAALAPAGRPGEESVGHLGGQSHVLPPDPCLRLSQACASGGRGAC